MWILNGLILIRTAGKTIPANQPLFSNIAQGYLSRTTGWILQAIIAIVLFISMFTGRRRKVKYGFTLPPCIRTC